jgi:broad specificity phosphatase PhoE
MMAVQAASKRMSVKMLFSFLVLVIALAAKERTYGQAVVYIVRHAEKAGNSGDVDLSEQGVKRANALAKLLKEANIAGIYTSQWKRTKQTAMPLASQRQIDPVAVPDGDPQITYDRIRADHPQGAVLVVGHSDTIKPLIQKWASDADLVIQGQEYEN